MKLIDKLDEAFDDVEVAFDVKVCTELTDLRDMSDLRSTEEQTMLAFDDVLLHELH